MAYKHNFYSVGHLAVGRTVDLRVTDSTVEAFLGGERLSTHPLLPAYARNRYSTHGGDLPEGRPCSGWDAGRIRRWANRAGPSCREVVDRIFQRADYDEQGLDAALAVPRPSRKHPGVRPERERATALVAGKRSPCYRDVEPILSTNQDKVVDACGGDVGPGADEAGYVRGAGFYGEEPKTELSVETKCKLRDMGAADLPNAFAAQEEGMCTGMTCAERVQMAVDEAHSALITSKTKNPTERTNLRCPEADVRCVDFDEGCGLGRPLIAELSACGLAERAQNVVLQGPIGTGKTYLACALSKAARWRRMRSRYVRCPGLEGSWRDARDRPGGERKLTRKHASFQVLVLDELLLDQSDELFRSFLLGLMEARYGTTSAIFCTRFRQKDWHVRLGGGVHAYAIMDRIVHGTAWVDMGDMSMRRKLGGSVG